jgi:hypothetical protein
MRSRGDDWADRVVAEMVAQGGDEAVKMLFRKVVRTHDALPDGLPDFLAEYLTKNDAPAWVDMDKVKAGEDFYCRHGLEIGAILLMASLPACYAAAKGVNVLRISHQLTKFPSRRVIETSNFVIDVMQPGGLSGEGHGVLTARKVRLLHAIERYILSTHATAHYDMAWGVPINQEDLALTLMTFATTVLDSLEKIGIAPHPEEAEAYFHAWRYVGYEMGIVEELLPENVADGRAMMAAISKAEYAASESGKMVTKSLTDFLEELIPGHWMDGIVASKIRFLVGDDVADMLGVKKTNWTISLILLEKILLSIGHKYVDDSPRLSAIANHFGKTLFEAMEKLIREDGRPDFHVPSTLRKNWKLAPHPSEQAVVNAHAPADAVDALFPTDTAVVSVPDGSRTEKMTPAK